MTRPILDAKSFKDLEVHYVCRNEHGIVYCRRRGDLSIGKCSYPPTRGKACTFARMPLRCALAVWEHTQRGNDLGHKSLQLRAPPGQWEPFDAEPHLVQDHGCYDYLTSMLGKGTIDDALRLRLRERGQYIGVENVERHRVT